jgi:hypothetical protein
MWLFSSLTESGLKSGWNSISWRAPPTAQVIPQSCFFESIPQLLRTLLLAWWRHWPALPIHHSESWQVQHCVEKPASLSPNLGWGSAAFSAGEFLARPELSVSRCQRPSIYVYVYVKSKEAINEHSQSSGSQWLAKV